MKRCCFISISFLLFLPLSAFAQDNLIQLKSAIHLSSTVSEGKYTPEEIAKIAKEVGISVVIFTDRNQMKWVYGLWP